MQKTYQYSWVVFYKEFAIKLLDYKENRSALIETIKAVYDDLGIKLPTLEQDNDIVDIDPFTVFGLFNKSSMTNENRIKIITAFAESLDISAKVPKSFNSIPVLNNQNATFYYFKGDSGRDNEDIDNLWALFSSALQYAHKQTSDNKTTISRYFDLVINKKGNANSKITMGLYWLAPEVYLNLDSRNKWYIYESGKIPPDTVTTLPSIKKKVAAFTYFSLIEKLQAYLESGKSKLQNFIDLSYEAWRYSEEVNQQQKPQSKRDTTNDSLADGGVGSVHYWIYSPGANACMWDQLYDEGSMAIGWDIGDYGRYATKEEMKQQMRELFDPTKSYMNAAHATWQFANEMKPGDIVFAKKGKHLLVGRGVVESDYQFVPDSPDNYTSRRKVKWTHNGEWPHPGSAVLKTLTDITPYTDYVEKLNALFENEVDEDVEEIAVDYPSYTEDYFLKEVYLSERSYHTLTNLLQKKMNVILQGAPGVGKTWIAKRLAYSLIGVKDPNRVMTIQFHQSYSYEDFIMGFRPSENGFTLKKGSFYNFCKKAEVDSENDYYFIIDEINRGNLSKIFGELFMLIETDKRGIELQLLYSDERFSVPPNVYIIGTMNTADRSLAMLDYALRRRFAFYELHPAFKSLGFQSYKTGINSQKFDALIDCIETLNNSIAADDSLGEGFCIGHSYFCNIDSADEQTLLGIIEFEIIPLLKEYWFDEPQKVKNWSNTLRNSVK